MATEGDSASGLSAEWQAFRASRFDATAWALDEYLTTPARAVRFGIRSLDKHLAGGLHEGVNVIMAEPGAGKTALGCHLAYTAAMDGVQAAVVSLEMPAAETWLRMVAEHAATSDELDSFNWGEVDVWRRRTCDAYDHDTDMGFEEAVRADPVLKASNDLWVRAPGLMVTDCGGACDVVTVASEISRLAALGCRLVVVDYLQRITAQGVSRYESLTAASHALTDVIRNAHIVAVVISSMGRSARKSGEVMAGADGTSAIEYDAETVWRLDRAEDAKDPDDASARVIKASIAKNRHGLTTGEDDAIYFSWWPALNYFR